MIWGDAKKYTRTLLGDSLVPSEATMGNETLALFLNEAMFGVAAETQPARSHFTGATIAYNDVTLSPTDSRREGRYPIPTTMISVKGIHIWVGSIRTQLERMSYDDFEDNYGMTDSGGLPEAYRVEFGVTPSSGVPGDIWFGPKPNGVYQFRAAIYRLPDKIAPTEDTRVMQLPDPFHRVVCYRAAMELAIRYDDSARANKMASLYRDGMDEAQRIVARMDRVGPVLPKSQYGGTKWWERRRR